MYIVAETLKEAKQEVKRLNKTDKFKRDNRWINISSGKRLGISTRTQTGVKISKDDIGKYKTYIFTSRTRDGMAY